jgi:hypothetical protein
VSVCDGFEGGVNDGYNVPQQRSSKTNRRDDANVLFLLAFGIRMQT